MMNININSWCKITTFILLICLLPNWSFAERISAKGKITVDYEVRADGTYRIIDVWNHSSNRITLFIDNEQVTINAGGSAKPNKIARRSVSYDCNGVGQTLLQCKTSVVPKVKEEVANEVVPNEKETPVSHIAEPVSHATEPNGSNDSSTTGQSRGVESPAAIDRVDTDAFFGTEAVAAYVQKTNSLADALSRSDNKSQFLLDNDVKKFLEVSEAELKTKKNEISDIAREAVAASKITDRDTQTRTLDLIIEILNGRYNQRLSAFDKLKNAVASVSVVSDYENPLKGSVINYSIIGVIVLVLAILIIIALRKRKKKAKSKSKSKSKPKNVESQSHQDSDPNNQAIVVRRRTTTILKKQSIDDVISNSEYMLINSSEFTPDSAVRKIYIKNTCIKEVYNLYAEDLRNSENPKEDGCMVLGRWVHDENSGTYDISLETVVFPGDDAVFKEYELNFGGKIKLRVAEKLRKLRRETNLQYDLVCWIHSHPGLGVFFSNSDDNVHMQLKHSQHPNFLIAFVVDILTSDQELGIFTFRKDGSMNSKGDLTKMYSLEDMYKWALASDKASFNPENYHNILASAGMRLPICKGIELNNSSIIDLTQILIEPATGIAGWAVGTDVQVNGEKEYVVSSIVKAEGKPIAGVIGILLNVVHMSLPTIQRLIADQNLNPSFVLVYSSRQNTLTSIPVINGELITDEHFYGEESIDDLKIWTRRKR